MPCWPDPSPCWCWPTARWRQGGRSNCCHNGSRPAARCCALPARAWPKGRIRYCRCNCGRNARSAVGLPGNSRNPWPVSPIPRPLPASLCRPRSPSSARCWPSPQRASLSAAGPASPTARRWSPPKPAARAGSSSSTSPPRRNGPTCRFRGFSCRCSGAWSPSQPAWPERLRARPRWHLWKASMGSAAPPHRRRGPPPSPHWRWRTPCHRPATRRAGTAFPAPTAPIAAP